MDLHPSIRNRYPLVMIERSEWAPSKCKLMLPLYDSNLKTTRMAECQISGIYGTDTSLGNLAVSYGEILRKASNRMELAAKRLVHPAEYRRKLLEEFDKTVFGRPLLESVSVFAGVDPEAYICGDVSEETAYHLGAIFSALINEAYLIFKRDGKEVAAAFNYDIARYSAPIAITSILAIY